MTTMRVLGGEIQGAGISPASMLTNLKGIDPAVVKEVEENMATVRSRFERTKRDGSKELRGEFVFQAPSGSFNCDRAS